MSREWASQYHVEKVGVEVEGQVKLDGGKRYVYV